MGGYREKVAYRVFWPRLNPLTLAPPWTSILHERKTGNTGFAVGYSVYVAVSGNDGYELRSLPKAGTETDEDDEWPSQWIASASTISQKSASRRAIEFRTAEQGRKIEEDGEYRMRNEMWSWARGKFELSSLA